MKEHKLINCINPTEHSYQVTLGTDMGQFTATVDCRKEDWVYESRYFGFQLAEIKCEIEYARAKKKHYQAQLKALTEFWRNMSTTRNYDQDAFWVKQMRKKVDDIQLMIDFWDNRIKRCKVLYYEKIVTRDKLNETKETKE
jgi:hypothetical protein